MTTLAPRDGVSNLAGSSWSDKIGSSLQGRGEDSAPR